MAAPEHDPAPGTDELLQAVYEELHEMASTALRGEAPGFTLQTGDLLHGAYERLQRQRSPWLGATHFKAIAATHIERVLQDYLRHRRARKRGGDWMRISLAGELVAEDFTPEEFLDLAEALRELERLDPTQAKIARLRILGGLTLPEIAAELSMAQRTLEGKWRLARAWLTGRLGDGP